MGFVVVGPTKFVCEDSSLR